MSKVKQGFVIPTYVYYDDDDREILNLQTSFIDCFMIESDRFADNRSIRYFISGKEFHAPYSADLITNVILPAMHARATDEEIDPKIISPN